VNLKVQVTVENAEDAVTALEEVIAWIEAEVPASKVHVGGEEVGSFEVLVEA
jgi:hypothetical protein